MSDETYRSVMVALLQLLWVVPLTVMLLSGCTTLSPYQNSVCTVDSRLKGYC